MYFRDQLPHQISRTHTKYPDTVISTSEVFMAQQKMVVMSRIFIQGFKEICLLVKKLLGDTNITCKNRHTDVMNP
jgi:hypothetical protein